MKAFLIKYDGLWMGGKAIVIAKTKKTALRLVEEDENTLEFTDVKVEEIIELDKPKILYNNNGDY